MGSSVNTVLAIVIFATVLNICYAQLTFTPNWGKRSLLPLGSNSPLLGLNGNGGGGGTNNGGIGSNNPSNAANFNGNGCKTSLDSLMMIYRLIQAEAQKYEECSQK